MAVSLGRELAQSRCRPLTAAAVLTVVVAVFSDLAAGEAPLHVATLGVVTALVAALRLRLAGRHRGLLQFVSGTIVAQPAVHTAAKLVPHGPMEHGLGHQLIHADVLATATQMVVALLIVAAVSFAEQIVTAVAGVVRVVRIRIWIHVPKTRARTSRVRRAPARERLTSRYRPGAIPRRGPPHRLLPAV